MGGDDGVLSEEEERTPKKAESPKKATSPKKPESPKRMKREGLTLTDTTVTWELSHVAALATCGTDGIQSPPFNLSKDGHTGPSMTVTFFPSGHGMSPAGCCAVMLEAEARTSMKFKVSAGAQTSGP